jgi:CRP-like cAMP-binding protein
MTSCSKDKIAANTPTLGDVWKMLEARGWLSERSPEVRDRLLGIAQVRVYQPGENLYSVGEEPQGVYGVARGALDISIPREDGLEIVIHSAQPGFWVGDLALFSSQRRLITATTATEVVAAFLSNNRLSQLLDRYPNLISDFYVLSHRNMATTLRLLANLSIPRAEARVALRLLIHDQKQTRTGDWLPMSQEKLAQLTALSLPTVQRTLRCLDDSGIVELGYGRLRVCDRIKLLERCSCLPAES